MIGIIQVTSFRLRKRRTRSVSPIKPIFKNPSIDFLWSNLLTDSRAFLISLSVQGTVEY